MIGGSFFCSPDGIRTRATALRGRRPRPLDDGARTRFKHVLFFALQELPFRAVLWKLSKLSLSESGCKIDRIFAGVPGLEPRMAVPETAVLPITPYPKGLARPCSFRFAVMLGGSSPAEKKITSTPAPNTKSYGHGTFLLHFRPASTQTMRLPLPYRPAIGQARRRDRAIPSTRTAEG